MRGVRKHKKSIIGSAFLLLFVSFFAIYYWNSLLIVEAKAEAHNFIQKLDGGVDAEQLFWMSFTKVESETKLKWKHEHEFMYDGKMFDIVDRYTRNDSMFYKVYEDTKETKLNKRISRMNAFLLGVDTEGAKDKNKLKIPAKDWFCTDVFSDKIPQVLRLQNYPIFSVKIINRERPVSIPPPEYC